MNDKDAEQVLVVPARILHEAGLFQGFSRRTEHYLPRLLDPMNLSYRRRDQVVALKTMGPSWPAATLVTSGVAKRETARTNRKYLGMEAPKELMAAFIESSLE